jgi:23S rRNA (cytosine1962-C5)-methyltransferase
MSIAILYPEHWKDYELLDCGDFEKLERFGDYITIRPEPQAVWPKIWTNKDWKERAHVKFNAKSSSSGTWEKLKKMPDNWQLKYPIHAAKHQQSISFKLALTAFKHVGVFPEQAANWEKIYAAMSAMEQPKFLNLFAYTGGASLAAKAAGAEVTHVDSIKQVVSWAKENMLLSNLDNIRWMIDDALKFAKKEARRGNLYQGIILDPPAFGHGPNGEKWKLEEQIHELVLEVLSILDPKKHLLILNAYSLGFSALILENLLKDFSIKNKSDLKIGELYLPAKSGVKLPLGVWGNLIK